MSIPDMTPDLCRAARALLKWSQRDLATRAGVAQQTVTHFEQGKRSLYERTIRDLREALEAGGVEFLPPTERNGAGIRYKEPPKDADLA
jgi:transcriptional regulator with XRE-family HTH domain